MIKTTPEEPLARAVCLRIERSAEHTNKFLVFLYNDCESQPNSLFSVETSEENKNIKRYSGPEEKQTTEDLGDKNCSNISPISLLLYDRHIDLIEELVKKSNMSLGSCPLCGKTSSASGLPAERCPI